jgi:hypothetical protein
LYSLGCPGTHFVDQAGLELRNPPASASRVLGLKACATTPGCLYYFLIDYEFSCFVALVEEVYFAQRERDEAIMCRLQLALKERDEAIAHVKHMEMSLKMCVYI